MEDGFDDSISIKTIVEINKIVKNERNSLELIDKVKELYVLGLSYTEIAAELKLATRSIVGGIINRARKTGFDFPKKKTTPLNKVKKIKEMANRKLKADKIKPIVKPYHPPVDYSEPLTPGTTLHDLSDKMCGAIKENGLYCGAPVLEMKRWCPYHFKKYTQPNVKSLRAFRG